MLKYFITIIVLSFCAISSALSEDKTPEIIALDCGGYHRENGGPERTPEEFKKIILDALSAEDWFRFHRYYANGEKIEQD